MNPNDPPPHRQGAPPSEAGERRRAERLSFTSECELSITAPAWAITKSPIAATTGNITLHGTLLKNVAVEAAVAQSWEAGIRDDVPIEVDIHFLALPDAPPIGGRIVWIDRRIEGGGHCGVGILFDIPRGDERIALEQLIQSIR